MQAYADLVAGGVITERQALAWVTLHRDGPMTGRELDEAAGARGLWKRLSELKSLGLVEELTPRLCRVSHRGALVWRACMPTVGPVATFAEQERRRTFWLALSLDRGTLFAAARSLEALRELLAPNAAVEIVEAREVRRTTTRSA